MACNVLAWQRSVTVAVGEREREDLRDRSARILAALVGSSRAPSFGMRDTPVHERPCRPRTASEAYGAACRAAPRNIVSGCHAVYWKQKKSKSVILSLFGSAKREARRTLGLARSPCPTHPR